MNRESGHFRSFIKYVALIVASTMLASSCAESQTNQESWDYHGAWVSADSLRVFDELVFVDSVKMLMTTGGLIVGSNAFYGTTNDDGIVVSIRRSGPNQYRLLFEGGEKGDRQEMNMVLTLLSADTLQIQIDSVGGLWNHALIMARNPKSRTATVMEEISGAIKHTYETLNYEVNLLDESSISKLPVYGNAVETSLGIGMLKAALLDRYIETDGRVGVAELTSNSCLANFEIQLVGDGNPSKLRYVRAQMKLVNGQWRIKFADLLGKEK